MCRVRARMVSRAALWLAAILSLTGSVGLHIEPFDLFAGPGHLAATFDAGEGVAHEAAHVCQICLLHFASSLTSTRGVVPVLVPASKTAAPALIEAPRGVDRCPSESRAPPTVL